MDYFSMMNYEQFKEQVCPRCDLLYELNRRQIVLDKIFTDYEEDLKLSDQTELKYDLGAEGVKEVYKNKCSHQDECTEFGEAINKCHESEIRLSKLMLYIMNDRGDKDIYYISSDVDPYYSMLSNRILRSTRTKNNVLTDKTDINAIKEQLGVSEENK